MLNKKGLLIITPVLAFAMAAAVIVPSLGMNNIQSTIAEAKLIKYHCADDASKGSVSSESYTITESKTGYYYSGFVSNGTFSDAGLTLSAGEYFQADLKGGSSTQIAFTSGSFAIELSNDNVNFTARHYVASMDTYNFHTLMRYIRVLCTADGVLTDVNIGCECSEDYTINTTTAMDEDVWSNNVKTNRVTLVGNQKGSNLDDFNYSVINGTRDSKGVYVFIKERVSGLYFDAESNNWWEHDNVEVEFSLTNDFASHQQYYVSTCDANHTNFDIAMFEKAGKLSGYDCWNVINYKAFVSYESLSARFETEVNSSSDLYFWFGSASGHGFDMCAHWGKNSPIKLTSNGIVDTTGNIYGTIANRTGDWGNTANWYEVTDNLTTSGRKTVATHVEGCQDYSGDNWADYCWRGPLSILPKLGDKGVRSVFRMDWFGWSDGYTPTSTENGGVWAPEAAKATNGKTQFHETLIDCDVVYVYSYNSADKVYTSLRCIFPNNPTVVTRGDYFMYQRVTTVETLGAYINAEFTNSILFNA